MLLKILCITLSCCFVSCISLAATVIPDLEDLSKTKSEDNQNQNSHYTWNIFTGGENNASGSPVNIIFSDIGINTSASNSNGIPGLINLPKTVSNCPQTETKPAIYWKDFNGSPGPEDALVAGTVTTSGTHGQTVSVYVGQVIDFTSKAGLQPVAVYSNSNTVQSNYGGVRIIGVNIKVLCTNVHPSKIGDFLSWIPAEDALKLDSNTDIVVTGYQETYKLHTGRTILNGQVILGKVVREKTLILYYPLGDKTIRLPTNFDVLVYTKAVYKIRKTK